MLRKLKTVNFCLLIFLFACLNNKNEKSVDFVETYTKYIDYYTNGKVSQEVVVLTDSTYLIMKYSEEGKLTDSVVYLNSKLNDLNRIYLRKINKKCLVSYDKNGFKNGKILCMYENNKKYCDGEYYKGVKFGSWLYYYKTGRIKSYEFYALDSIPVYLKKYDETGNVIKEGGDLIWGILRNSDTIAYGDTFKSVVSIINDVPNSKAELICFVNNDNYKSINEFDDNGYYNFSYLPANKGIFNIKFNWVLTDTITGNERKGNRVINVLCK